MQSAWNQFWKRNEDGRFTQVSWSKRRMVAILKRYLESGASVLDAGSGSGFFSNFFVTQGCQTYSLDYCEEALALTRRQTGERAAGYLCYDLLDGAFARQYAGQFDLVFSDGLFEHFTAEEQDCIFGHLQHAKRPGGLIVTFVPNRYSFWTLVRPLFMPGIQERPFTLKGLKDLCTRNGSAVVEAGGANVLPWRASPEALLGHRFGMLLYTISR